METCGHNLESRSEENGKSEKKKKTSEKWETRPLKRRIFFLSGDNPVLGGSFFARSFPQRSNDGIVG